MTPLAALRAAEVEYPGRGPALGPVDLAIGRAEIVALVGPSGCGKSTALRLLAGLERPSRGEVDRTVPSGRTAVVFQAPTLRPWSSARAEVALPLELAGLPRDEALSRADAALARVGLSDAAAARPAQLSGGMAMRVSLARALAVNPELLLLDEPFAALDAVTKRALSADVHRLWSELRPGVVFVTHDVDEAVQLSTRVLVMTRGPGRLAAEFVVDAPIPRPDRFRASAAFRETSEAISDALVAAAGEAS